MRSRSTELLFVPEAKVLPLLLLYFTSLLASSSVMSLFSFGLKKSFVPKFLSFCSLFAYEILSSDLFKFLP